MLLLSEPASAAAVDRGVQSSSSMLCAPATAPTTASSITLPILQDLLNAPPLPAVSVDKASSEILGTAKRRSSSFSSSSSNNDIENIAPVKKSRHDLTALPLQDRKQEGALPAWIFSFEDISDDEMMLEEGKAKAYIL
jgi:hypothetical protein